MPAVGTREMNRNGTAVIHKYNKNTERKSDMAYKRDRKMVPGEKTL